MNDQEGPSFKEVLEHLSKYAIFKSARDVEPPELDEYWEGLSKAWRNGIPHADTNEFKLSVSMDLTAEQVAIYTAAMARTFDRDHIHITMPRTLERMNSLQEAARKIQFPRMRYGLQAVVDEVSAFSHYSLSYERDAAGWARWLENSENKEDLRADVITLILREDLSVLEEEGW